MTSHPYSELQELPDGNYLLSFICEGERTIQIVIDRRFGVCLAQQLLAVFLSRKLESDFQLEAVR